MKNLIATLFTVIVVLSGGGQHIFENAGVYESKPYEYDWKKTMLTDPYPVEFGVREFAFQNYAKADEPKVFSIERHDKDQYIVIFDNESNNALAIYPKDSVTRIDHK
jgi:hypothetical protein